MPMPVGGWKLSDPAKGPRFPPAFGKVRALVRPIRFTEAVTGPIVTAALVDSVRSISDPLIPIVRWTDWTFRMSAIERLTGIVTSNEAPPTK